MSTMILKYIHLIAGTLLLGTTFAFYFYFLLNQGRVLLIFRILKVSLWMDLISFISVMLVLFTGAKLVSAYHLAFSLPWIRVAYALLTGFIFCWLCSMLIKCLNLRAFNDLGFNRFVGRFWMHVCYILMFAILVTIVHDAVTQSTRLL